MALSDIPKIPPEYKPRVKKLFNKMKADEITLEELLTTVLTVLGKVTFDSNGLKIVGEYGSFEIDKRLNVAVEGFLLNLYDLTLSLINKQFLVKRGDQINKHLLWIIPVRATKSDIKNQKLPIIEFDMAPMASLKKSVTNAFNLYLQEPLTEWEPFHPLFKIHRIEEFAGFLGKDWRTGSNLFKLPVPLFDLLTKEVMDKLDESMAPFCDQVLKKFGV